MSLQLAQSQKMDAIGQLAGGVAHDFNNMLGGVMGGAELLETYLPENNEETRSYLSLILKSEGRAADLTQKLMIFARKEQAASAVVDVHLLISDTISLLEKTIDKRIKIRKALAADHHFVIGDGSLLQSSFFNLEINASHAMPEGGELTFSTRPVDISENYCEKADFEIQPGHFILIEIRDTGCGIPEENIRKIFEPFFTTKEPEKGTGLGLAAVYGTVKQHHGAIEVNSEVGAGTVFRIMLPVAENGREAMELLKKHSDRIDLVILDMIMPEMNGRDCFKRSPRQQCQGDFFNHLHSDFSGYPARRMNSQWDN